MRLRLLGRGERDLVAAFFNGLSTESRRRRFLQATPRLPEEMLRYLVDVDGRRHVALVAEVDGECAVCNGLVEGHQTLCGGHSTAA